MPRYPAQAAWVSCIALLSLAGCAAGRPPASVAVTPAAAPILRIIGTNDFHGALEARANSAGVSWGGAVALAGVIAQARAECVAPACYSILLDAGDEYQGQAVSTLAHGRPVSAIFNRLGYDVAALGNHDLDWGRAVFQERRAEQHYPVLSANLRYADGRAVEWVSPDALVRRGPFAIGVIGIMTAEAPTAIAASNIVGLRFPDAAPIVDSFAADLRARGANIVVLLAHAGGRCDSTGTVGCHGEIFDLARRLTQHVDAIVSGHSHELVNSSVNGIPVTGARMSGQAVGVTDLAPDGRVVRRDVRFAFADSTPRDTAVARLVADAVAAAGPRLNEVIAQIGDDMPRTGHEYALGNLIVDGMRAAGHADFAVTNETGIRAPLRAGPATFGALFEIQPFGNRLVVLSATGDAMRRYFEKMIGPRGPITFVSGAAITVDTTRAAGHRITRIMLPSGRTLDDAATYTIVLTDFLHTGGLGLYFPEAGAAVRELPGVDLDATVNYLRELPTPVRAPRDQRWTLLPRPN